MFIDIYTHILPPKVASALEAMGGNLGIAKRMKAVRDVHDFESRFRSMDQIKDYRQIISLPNPPIEAFTTPAQAIELARVANDGMAELVAATPDRFPAFVAALPMHEVEPSLAEIKRAIDQLGAKGIQLFTNVNGKPIDAKEYEPLFALAAELRSADLAASDAHRRFPRLHDREILALRDVVVLRLALRDLGRDGALVFTGLFDRYPKLKIITHHGGGMIAVLRQAHRERARQPRRPHQGRGLQRRAQIL